MTQANVRNDELIKAILDTLIPADPETGMPGAGSLGLEDEVLGEASAVHALLDAGLEAAANADFVAGTSAERIARLQEVEAIHPGFIGLLFVPTCGAYYRHPEALVGLGLEPRPPHPIGYQLEPGDLSTLERVRQRGKIYREA
jgi:hypothetical protein